MDRDRLADLNSNWAAWLRFTADHAEGGESRTFGAIRCSSVGVPMPLFNQAFVTEEPAVDDVALATSWLSERNVPFWVTAPAPLAPAVAGMAEAVGLDRTATTMPGMAYAPLSGLPDESFGPAELVQVTDPDQLDHFAVVAAEAFGAPSDAAGTLAPSSTLDDDRCSWFLGYVDGVPAACGQLFVTGDTAGVYAIGVRQDFRQRGLGAAVSWSVLAAGREAGCSMGVLQASPMGQPVYRRMGFETVTQYSLFVPAG